MFSSVPRLDFWRTRDIDKAATHLILETDVSPKVT